MYGLAKITFWIVLASLVSLVLYMLASHRIKHEPTIAHRRFDMAFGFGADHQTFELGQENGTPLMELVNEPTIAFAANTLSSWWVTLKVEFYVPVDTDVESLPAIFVFAPASAGVPSSSRVINHHADGSRSIAPEREYWCDIEEYGRQVGWPTAWKVWPLVVKPYGPQMHSVRYHAEWPVNFSTSRAGIGARNFDVFYQRDLPGIYGLSNLRVNGEEPEVQVYVMPYESSNALRSKVAFGDFSKVNVGMDRKTKGIYWMTSQEKGIGLTGVVYSPVFGKLTKNIVPVTLFFLTAVVATFCAYGIM